MRALARIFPIARWLPRYSVKESLSGDLSAGLTVAVMLIPQAMAYALLAGLPPVMGLYASTLPLLAYALFGSSRQLAVGPVAMDSMLVAAGLIGFSVAGSEDYVAMATLLAGMVGLFHLTLGLLRMGFLVSFLSRPVVSGFSAAASITIALSQVPHLFGISVGRSPHAHELLYQLLTHLGATHPATLALGAGGVIFLVVLKRLRPRWPRALFMVVITTVIVWALGLDRAGPDGVGVAVVGQVPSGMPSIGLPTNLLAHLSEHGAELATTAFTIAIVALMESVSVSKTLAEKHGYELDPDRELIGIGAANLAGFFAQGYPLTGGLSRSAVNDQAGAKTPLAGAFTALLVILTLLFLTPLLYFLPKASLAAIVVVAVLGLVKPSVLRELWRVRRHDAALYLLTFGVTLLWGIREGIAAGVLASLLYFIYRTSRPHIAIVGRLPGRQVFRNVARFAEAEVLPGVLFVRFDARLYFANAPYLRAQLREAIERAEKEGEAVRHLVLDLRAMNDVDASGVHALRALDKELSRRGTTLHLSGAHGPVHDVLERSGLLEEMGARSQHLDLYDAWALLSEPGPEDSALPRAA